MKVNNVKEFADYIENKMGRKFTQYERMDITIPLLTGVANTESMLKMFEINANDLELDEYFDYINTPLEKREEYKIWITENNQQFNK